MTTPDQPKRTRPWKPSARDHALYRAVVIEGRTQRAAGQEFGRSQSAVSRLLKRFERWRGGAKPEDIGDLDAIRQAHLDRWLARQRHDEVYTRAIRLARRMEEEPAATHRKGQRGETEWHEEVKRDQLAAAGQMLKAALRANEALDKFAEKEPLLPIPGTETEVNIQELLALLTRLRQKSEESGSVPKCARPKAVTEVWLRALLGEGQEWYLGTYDVNPAAIVELIQSVLGSRIGLEDAVNKLRASEAAKPAASNGDQKSGAGNQESGALEPSGSTSEIADQSGGAGLERVPSTESSAPSTDTEPQAAVLHPQSAIANPQWEPAPTHPTHTRISVGGHPPPRPPQETEVVTPERLKRWDPYRGGGTVVMIDPGAGKKFGEPTDDYADDPLGRLYRRIEERLQREVREARLRAAAGG